MPSGLERLSDAALSGAAAGATSSQTLGLATTGRFAPTASIVDNPVFATHGITPANMKYTRAALSRLKNGTGDFTMIARGDSILTVGGGGNDITDSIVRYAAKNLATRLGLTARHALIPYKSAGTARTEWSALGTGWSQWVANFLGSHYGFTSASGNTNAMTFTPMDDSGTQINVDSFTVVVFGGSGSGFQWAIDGGSYTTQTNSSSSTGQYNRFTVSAGARGLHTLSIKPAASGSDLFVLGAAGEDSTTRSIRYMTGGTSGASTPATAVDDSRPLAADLTMFNYGTNDSANQVALATYQTNIQTLATAPASWTRPSDVLWLAWPPKQTAPSPITEASYYATLDVAVDLAGVPVMHIDRVVGSYTTGNASPLSLYNDGTHLNAAGRQMWGSALAGLLATL